MTPAAIQSEIRSLTRQLKALRRKLRGPRAKAAAKARRARRRERVKAICDAWLDIKKPVEERAGVRCEYRDSHGRCFASGVEFDHFWGGHGRRRALQSIESVWLLCPPHHNAKTLNMPSRAWWVDVFHEHVLAHGLKSQLPLIAAERARIEGKGRTT